MQLAIYRRGEKGEDQRLSLPGADLDWAALDREAERRWGRGLIRICSWLACQP